MFLSVDTVGTYCQMDILFEWLKISFRYHLTGDTEMESEVGGTSGTPGNDLNRAEPAAVRCDIDC